MDIKKVLVVYKKSTYHLYNNEVLDNKVKNLISENHISVNKLKDSHNRHEETLNSVINDLKELNIESDVIPRNDLKTIEDYDLVITIGGDGTVLETSKYIDDIPVLGVNSDVLGSVGFFTGANKDSFREKINLVLNDRINISHLTRIKLIINGKEAHETVMNDVLISHSIPAATSRYIIRKNGKEESHRGSGIWISTASGSTGAIRSAGGLTLPIESEKYQYLVREFYDRGDFNYSNLGGVCSFDEDFEVISQMRLGRIYIDGPFFQYDFIVGDSLKIKKHHKPLKILGFDALKRQKFLIKGRVFE